MAVTVYDAFNTLTTNRAALQTLGAYYTPARYIMEEIQTLAIAADATAKTYLDTNRAFIGNTTGSTVTIHMNGTTFSLSNSKYYCATRSEVDFMINQVPTLIRGTVALFDSDGEVLFFTE